MGNSLDDSSYQAVLENAMEQLRGQAPWWTHREASDPGVTLLELWALLADMQSFYLDQIQESHYRKYLKLLGISPDEGECARAWIFYDNVTEDCTIPRGTKLLADTMVFETEEETFLTANRLTGFYQGDNRNRMNVMKMRRKNRFVLRQENPLFTFTLEHAVKRGRELTIFVLLDERKNRNPVEGDFCMARLAWEYRTEKGWREARILWDETKGLLYSGRVCLRVDGEMKGSERTEGEMRDSEGTDSEMRDGEGTDSGRGYEVRCRIKEGGYDILPVLYKICLNTGRVVQQETLCHSEHVMISEQRPCAVLQSYLAKTGELRVFLRRGDEEWEDITERCHIDPPITANRRERFVRPAKESLDGEAVECRIVCCAQETNRQYRPCHITGVTSQRIALPWEGMIKSQVRLMLRQETGGNLYREYRQQEPEDTNWANAWQWQGETILLGDGRHGDIPEEAEDGLLLTSLVLSESGKGNVAIGKIRTWEKPELFGTITFRNLMAGGGGRTGKKPSEQFAEAGEFLKRQNRLVMEEDIQKLAMETPGLVIGKVSVEWKNGTVEVKIFPKESIQNKKCREKYRSQTAKHLERYRMVAGRIHVTVSEEGYSE